MDPDRIVIVGGGQAGVQLADSLREEGFEAGILILHAEAHLPYQRPPLSKDFVGSPGEGDALPLRGESFYAENGIELRGGTEVVAIDRRRKTVRLADATEESYGTLVLATGARNRPLTVEGADLEGVHSLRTLDDAIDLRDALAGVGNALVIGAGFIGLEFAAAAAKRGVAVTVLEFASRVMARAVTPEVSEWFQGLHAARGVDIRLGEGVAALRGRRGRVVSGMGTSGAEYPASLVVAGVGVVPATELAAAAGLTIDNGIAVDEFLRTIDPYIYAIGDCCSYPNAFAGTRTRLESVQNAVDHAIALAKTLTGNAVRYAETPWFWSQQGDTRLQIVGIAVSEGRTVLRGDPGSGSFSVFDYADGSLRAVETINNNGVYLAARRILGRGLPLTPEQAADSNFDLRGYSRGVKSAPN